MCSNFVVIQLEPQFDIPNGVLVGVSCFAPTLYFLFIIPTTAQPFYRCMNTTKKCRKTKERTFLAFILITVPTPWLEKAS